MRRLSILSGVLLVGVCGGLSLGANPALADSLHPLRKKIVEMGASQIGLVKDARGPDGYKVGWQRLIEFYKTAFKKTTLPAYTSDGLKKVGARAKYAAHWCGIFALWAARTAGATAGYWGPLGKWGWGIVGFNKSYGTKGMEPGDIVIIKNPPGKNLNHHALVEKIEGGNVHTIDGNSYADGVNQVIRRIVRPLSKVLIHYTTVPAGTPVPEHLKPKPTPRRVVTRRSCRTGYRAYTGRNRRTYCCRTGTKGYYNSSGGITCKRPTVRRRSTCRSGYKSFKSKSGKSYCCPPGTKGYYRGTTGITCKRVTSSCRSGYKSYRGRDGKSYCCPSSKRGYYTSSGGIYCK